MFAILSLTAGLLSLAARCSPGGRMLAMQSYRAAAGLLPELPAPDTTFGHLTSVGELCDAAVSFQMRDTAPATIGGGAFDAALLRYERSRTELGARTMRASAYDAKLADLNDALARYCERSGELASLGTRGWVRRAQPEQLSQEELREGAELLGVREGLNVEDTLDAVAEKVAESNAKEWRKRQIAARLSATRDRGLAVHTHGSRWNATGFAPELGLPGWNGESDERPPECPWEALSLCELRPATERAMEQGLRDGRRQCAEARKERAERLFEVACKLGFGLIASERTARAQRVRSAWDVARSWRRKLDELANGVTARYKAGVDRARDEGEWARLYLTRAQFDAVMGAVWGARKASKAERLAHQATAQGRAEQAERMLA